MTHLAKVLVISTLCVILLSSSGLSGSNFNALGSEERNNSTATEVSAGHYSETFNWKIVGETYSCEGTHFCQETTTQKTVLEGSLIKKEIHNEEEDRVFFEPYPVGALWAKCHLEFSVRDLTVGTGSTHNVDQDYFVGSANSGPGDPVVTGSIQAIGKDDLVENSIDLEGTGTQPPLRCSGGGNFGPWKYTISRAPSGMVTVHGEMGNTDGDLSGSLDFVIDQSERENEPPVANATASPNPAKPSDKVILDGSGSKDPDVGDSIVSYQWEQIEGPSVSLDGASLKIASFTAPSVQKNTTFSFSLSVQDTKAAIGSTTVSVRVEPKIILSVDIANSEINPYPINVDPPKPQTEITLTTKDPDGKPAKDVKVELKACSQAGSATTDGHTHDVDTGDGCFHSIRPKSTLVSNGQKGNPITVTTDSTGIAKVLYNPPTSSSGGRDYYISGLDKIVASLVDDPKVKDESKSITTKVAGLERISLSSSCPGGDQTYYFEMQSNHDCLFFGTHTANTELVQVAKDFRQRQIDCAKAKNPSKEPACDVTPPGNKGPGKQFVIIKGTPIAIKITAAALPWGGLSDINGDWKPPHATHNDGKNVDIGFNIKGTSMSKDQKRLLRDTILDNGQLLPYTGEGKEDDVTKAQDHFHIQFVECSPDSNPFSSIFKSNDIDGGVCKLTIEGTVQVDLNKRGILPLKQIKIEVCPDIQNCVQVYTNERGEYKAQISKPNEKSVQIRVSLEDMDKIFRVVSKKAGTSPAEITILKLLDTGNQADVTFSAEPPYAFLNGEPAGVQAKDANVKLDDFAHLAALYFYSHVGVEFGKKYLPSEINFRLPLDVVGNVVELPGDGSRILFRGGDKPHILINIGYSALATDKGGPAVTEARIDTYFHEFGHFLEYEAKKGDTNLNLELHPGLAEFLDNNEITMAASSHNGYANVDSSGALSEGLGTFIAAAISDTMLTDKGHAPYQSSAMEDFTLGGEQFNLERGFDNPVGNPIISTSPFRTEPFFEYVRGQEEYNIASLFWDLHDGLKDDNIQLPLSTVLTAAMSSDTVADLYTSLKFLVPEPLLKGLYASFGLCDDIIGIRSLAPDGKCQFSEVDNGLTTWMARFTHSSGKVFDFKYSQGRP